MNRLLKTTLVVMGILIIGAGVVIVTAVISPIQNVLAQAPTQTPSTPRAPGNSTVANNAQQYWDFFWNSFAQQLNVDVSKLKYAFTTAVDNTIDKAVSDGMISQAQGSNLKADLSNFMEQGPTSLGKFPFILGKGSGFSLKGGFGNAFGLNLNLGTAEFAKALNISEQTLISDLQSGQTINQVATSLNLDPAKVKATVLADVKTQLDAAVSSSIITQAQADQIYSSIGTKINSIMSESELNENHSGGMNRNGGNGRFRPGSGGNNSGTGL